MWTRVKKKQVYSGVHCTVQIQNGGFERCERHRFKRYIGRSGSVGHVPWVPQDKAG